MIYLDLDDLLHIAERVIGPRVHVRDFGLLESAVARPLATAGGKDAYPNIHEKAAALLLSLCRNHALVDGNKRLGLAGVIAFYGVNGYRLILTNDQAFELVSGLAEGGIDDVRATAKQLRTGTKRIGPRSSTRQ